jgi:hypothetical protein
VNALPETLTALCCANIPLAEVSYGVIEEAVEPERSKVTELAEPFELIATITSFPVPV